MHHRSIAVACFILLAQALCAESMANAVKDSGIRGGIVVHLGSGDGRKTADMLLNDSYLVHGLDTSRDSIAKARTYLRDRGLYGAVSVAWYDGKTLPYGDNTINLLVADALGKVPVAEAMRVLTPLGAMVIGGKKTVKPWPENIDDWPQYLNKADNNAVAKDSVAGPPRLVQWVGDPVWGRSHMGIPTVAAMVSGNGRLFTIEDAAPPDNPFLPAAFRIAARDAFNGKQLWARKITRWESVTMYIKSQPVQQQRRMVVVGDTLYCTFDLEGPVSAVDVLVTDGSRVYLRHKAFDLDLADASAKEHILPTSHFLDGEPQHRTFWMLASSLIRRSADAAFSMGDIMVSNGKEYYEVRGFPIYANHSYFDPRKNGYTLFAGVLGPAQAPPQEGLKPTQYAEMWRVHIPITGKAIAMAGDALYVAGEPMQFEDPSYSNYVDAYGGRLGGRLLVVSAKDGERLAQYELEAPPAWDGMAAANGRLYVALQNGNVVCMANRKEVSK